MHLSKCCYEVRNQLIKTVMPACRNEMEESPLSGASVLLVPSINLNDN